METRQLESRIATLRSRARRLLALHGFGRVVGPILPLIVLACLADWSIHLDSGVRLAFLVALAGLSGWLVSRFVLPPLLVKFSDLSIASRIEERWPGLNDRLTSTVEFLRLGDDEDRHGSKELREATIGQTLAEAETINFREVIDPRPARRSLGLALAGVLLVCMAVFLDPASARLAGRRLFLPFGGDRWPQATHLSLLANETTLKIAKGDPFSLALTVAPGEQVPTSARATYRFDSGDIQTESLRPVEGGAFRGRIEAVEEPFTFSVEAGDDSTSLRDVKVAVVPPPAVKELVVKVVAPEYTQLPPLTLAPGRTQVRAVEGSKIELSGLATKPLKSATLRFSETKTAPMALTGTAGRFEYHFGVGEPSAFWVELVDTEGFKSRDPLKYDMRSYPDESPKVVIDEPVNDRDVPAGATVPVLFHVDDDFGIQAARLVYKVAAGGSEPLQDVVLPLWDSSDSPNGASVKHQSVTHNWDLAPLKLSPGSLITFHADATDFDAIKGPNLGKSRELRLRIISDEEAIRQSEDARRAIREDIEGILAMQTQAKAPVEDALRTLDKTDKLNAETRANLKNAEMIQQQVGSRITNKTDGLDQKIGRFLEDLKNFKVPNADAQKQMEEMKEAVGRVRDNHLEPALQGLTRAGKSLENAERRAQEGAAGKAQPQPKLQPQPKAESPPSASKGATPGAAQPKSSPSGATPKGSDGASEKGQKGSPSQEKSPASESPEIAPPGQPKTEAGQELADAQRGQQAISDELKKMLDGLSEFETYRGVVKDAQDLLKEQEQVIKQTTEAATKPEMTGKTPDQLSQEQKADLGNLAARQSNVAKGVQGLQEKLDEMAKKLAESDPLASAAMNEAAQQSRKQGTSAKASEAAEQLEKNQMGSARSGQEQTRQDLKDLVDSIQNRRERELARLVKELKEAEEQLDKLRKRQTQNLEKTKAAQKIADKAEREKELKRLAKEQAEIQKQLESQLKRLAKLNQNATKAGQRASGKMGQAQRNLDQGQGEQGEQNQDEALADLEEAQDEVKQARREAEEQLAMEQLAKMGDQLRSIAERQDKLATDTGEYEKLRAEREGKLTLAQKTGVRNLSAIEEAIKDEADDLAEKLEGAPVFSLTVKRAAQRMENAARRLQDLNTDETTQREARSAADRFKQLIDSLKPDAAKAGGQQQQQGGNGGGGGGGGGGDGIPPAAQIKMLKALQQEINDRTGEFDEIRRRGKELTPDQTAELGRLKNDQGTLADIVRDLTKPKSDDSEVLE